MVDAVLQPPLALSDPVLPRRPAADAASRTVGEMESMGSVACMSTGAAGMGPGADLRRVYEPQIFMAITLARLNMLWRNVRANLAELVRRPRCRHPPVVGPSDFEIFVARFEALKLSLKSVRAFQRPGPGAAASLADAGRSSAAAPPPLGPLELTLGQYFDLGEAEIAAGPAQLRWAVWPQTADMKFVRVKEEFPGKVPPQADRVSKEPLELPTLTDAEYPKRLLRRKFDDGSMYLNGGAAQLCAFFTVLMARKPAGGAPFPFLLLGQPRRAHAAPTKEVVEGAAFEVER